MSTLFSQVATLGEDVELLRRRRYGMIEIVDERLARIVLRPLPRWASLPEIHGWGRWQHARQEGNRCRLFYNQPRRHGRYLALKYVQSTHGATLRTFRLSLLVLDEIARIKGTDAIVTDVANLRISARLLKRWGWAPHLESRWHRHYIKRFYGQYPPPEPGLWDAAAPAVASAASPTAAFGGEPYLPSTTYTAI